MAHDSAAHDSANIDSNVDAIHDNNNNYNDDDDDQVDADDVDDDRDEVDTTNPTNMATKTAPGTDSSISSYLLPLSSITKVCKQVLPESMSIQKDSKAVLQKATTLFISYLSTTARDQGKCIPHEFILLL